MNHEAAKALAAAPTEPTLEKPLRRVRYRGRNARHFREKYKETQFTASPPNWRQHMAAWPYVGEWLCASIRRRSWWPPVTCVSSTPIPRRAASHACPLRNAWRCPSIELPGSVQRLSMKPRSVSRLQTRSGNPVVSATARTP